MDESRSFSDTRLHHCAREDPQAVLRTLDRPQAWARTRNTDVTEQDDEVLRQSHRHQDSCDLETRSGTVEVGVQRVCELSHHEARPHLLGSLPPVTPSSRPNLSTRFSSRNCLIHRKTLHQIEFSIPSFHPFIEGKFFQRVLLKIEAVSHDCFEL